LSKTKSLYILRKRKQTIWRCSIRCN